jgi:inner membrane protein
MEPITHAIASVALSRCGFSKTTRLALPMIVTASLAAELDWLSVLAGPRAFLAAHCTAADSLLGAVVIAAIVAAVFIRIGERFSRPIRFLPAFLACLAGASLHVLLNLTNSYGVKLLWPFSGKWFALDLAAPFDPWIVLILLAGLPKRSGGASIAARRLRWRSLGFISRAASCCRSARRRSSNQGCIAARRRYRSRLTRIPCLRCFGAA